MRPVAVHLAWFDEERGVFTGRSLLVGESAVVNGLVVELATYVADGVTYPQIVFARPLEDGDA